jgi:hypothetical protein
VNPPVEIVLRLVRVIPEGQGKRVAERAEIVIRQRFDYQREFPSSVVFLPFVHSCGPQKTLAGRPVVGSGR